VMISTTNSTTVSNNITPISRHSFSSGLIQESLCYGKLWLPSLTCFKMTNTA
jgi:hypothetical protein